MSGSIVTGVLAIGIGIVFFIGFRKIVRKFTKGESDCCSTSACGSCSCQCASKK
ncbi:hypothetical protein [Anaerosinus sp.]|uniref:hypothetical protein n=1 Tax=Selenobaculum sp. TaxID=3074374 RepID=UPI0015AE8C3D